MKRLLPLLALTLVFAGCVDTTGISPTSSRTPRGNPQAAVVVTEFGDLQCPACRSAHETINKPLVEKYSKEVSFQFAQFPLRSIHRYAMDLAEASECAADQRKFWEYVDLAYQNQDQLSKSAVRDWAKSLQLDMDLYDRCTKSHIKRDAINAEVAQGQQLGVQGTPTYFVNGRQVEATLEAISAAIDEGVKTTMQRL